MAGRWVSWAVASRGRRQRWQCERIRAVGVRQQVNLGDNNTVLNHEIRRSERSNQAHRPGCTQLLRDLVGRAPAGASSSTRHFILEGGMPNDLMILPNRTKTHFLLGLDL